MQVNLSQPPEITAAPLQACQSTYDNGQTSYYESELTEESFQSAEQNAHYH